MLIIAMIKGVQNMESENVKREIVLPEELQKSILKFFLKTSIPRLAQKKKALSEKEGQEKE